MSSCLTCGPFHGEEVDPPSARATSPTDSDPTVLEDIQTLREMLTRKVQMMDAVRMHQNAMEVVMKELDDQVQTARYALDDLASKMQIQNSNEVKESEIVTLEPRDQAVDASNQDVQTSPSAQTQSADLVPAQDVVKLPTAIELASEQSDRADPGTLYSKLQNQLQNAADIQLPTMERGWWNFIRSWCRRLVDEKGRIGQRFEYAVCMIIVANSIIIGIESELSLTMDTSSWARPVELTFLFLYTLEIVVRLIAKGWRCFQDRWFQFDFILVAVSLVGQIVSTFSAQISAAIQQVLVFRTMRLLRLLRAFKMIKQLRTVWRLVYGLITSGETMISTLALLCLVLYIFAVLGLEAIAKDTELQEDPDTQKIITDHFNSLFVSMITLTQFVTSDSIAAIYLPLMKKKPELGLYFMLLMIMVSISLMNLVTAVIVEGALEHARQDREEEQKILTASAKNMLTDIGELFKKLDQDQNEVIVMDEVKRAEFKKEVEVPSHILDKASVDSMTELFQKLDVDKSGVLTRDEFTEGLLNIFLLDVPVADMQVMKMVRLLRTGVQKIDEDLALLKRVVCESHMSNMPAEITKDM